MGRRDVDLVAEQALRIAEKLIRVSRPRAPGARMPDLTEAEVVVLAALARQPRQAVPVRAVLQETGFSPSRLSKVIKELESRKRLIRGQRAEGDRRRVELMIQKAGLAALREFKRLRKKRLQLVFQQLSQDDFKMVSEAVALFSQALDRALARTGW
jgi:DNA-binding MarR family transcriptional regulator